MLPNYRERTTKVAPFFYSLRLSQSALGIFGLNTGVRGNPPKLNRNFQRLPFGGQIWHPYRPKSATRRTRGLPSERSAGLAEKRLQPENNRTRRVVLDQQRIPSMATSDTVFPNSYAPIGGCAISEDCIDSPTGPNWHLRAQIRVLSDGMTAKDGRPIKNAVFYRCPYTTL